MEPANMIYPDDFESKIGFDQIRSMVDDLCLCELGREKVRLMHFLQSFPEIELHLNLTSEFKEICIFEENFPADNYVDVTPWLKKIKVEGSYLETEELSGLKKSLETIRAILRFFKNREDNDKYPALKGLVKDVTVYPFVLEKIDGILNKYGKIKDNASPELNRIRKNIQQKQSEISRKLQSVLKHARDAGIVNPDAELTIRNGRPVIPVPSSNKRGIKGFIHDESASGRTSFIEPVEIVESNNEIRELEYAERREIIRILTEFATVIRPYLDDLLLSYDFLGTIDFLRAKALFAVKIEAVKPAFFSTRSFRWQRAVHPLLFLTHQKEDKEVIPLDITLDEYNRILLISGPNAGGKSVCLKTVGMLQYMLQCGMLVPLSENSEMGLFNRIFIDIGDEQSLENDLSTYSSHLMNMKFFLKNSDKETLLLIDEFGTGTEPMLGGAIAEAMLDRMNRNGSFGVITTHYTNLKHFASSTEGIINGAMLFDTHQIQPLYRLEIGKPGSSFAIDIARKIGVPEEILQSATEKLGQEHIDFDKHLREIIRDKQYWANKRSKIRLTEKKLEELSEKYASELEQTKQLRKEIIEKAKYQAGEIVNGANREFEKTIREIRESQAEKEHTKKVRRDFEKFTDHILDEKTEEDIRIERKLEQIKNRQERKQEERKQNGDKTVSEKESFKKESAIEAGDKVRLFGQDTVGEVLDVNNGSILVAFGSMITTVKESRLEKISNKEYKRQARSTGIPVTSNYNVGERKLNFSQEIDVRGKRADEALALVQKFVDEALVVDVREVRILHGKGNGILRQLIRDYLATVDVVKSFKDENVEHGGAGITVVTFDY